MKNWIVVVLLLTAGILLQAEEHNNFVTLQDDAPAGPPVAEVLDLAEESLFDDDFMMRYRLNRLHKIAGYATLAMGLLTGLSAGEADDDFGEGSIHQSLGIATASLSAVTLGLGYAAHRGEWKNGESTTADTIHALLGITGGVMMVAVPFVAPSETHQILGEAGLVTMGIAVGWELIY